MFALLALSLVLSDQGSLERDPYGVPIIKAPTAAAAWRTVGRAVAEDRLWQLELSRRGARGKLAAVLGKSYVAADKEVLGAAYTDDELQAQVDAMPEVARTAFAEYAAGINETIALRIDEARLPSGYAEHGFAPEPWTPIDSAAIAVRMARLFGTGGAGELRNQAMLAYLSTQPAKDQALDVFDDFAWRNDPESIPTVTPGDDPLAANPWPFPTWDRATTQKHLARLPQPSLLELLPAIRAADYEESDLVAQDLATPFKAGSYAIVVGKERSVTGYPLLLTAPQMGHTTPSIIYEVAIDSPELQVAGLTVPGIPAVMIGTTPRLAWGLTSGVADMEDVFVAEATEGGYRYGDRTLPVSEHRFQLEVKGEAPQEVVQKRTHVGPVLLQTRGGDIYTLRSSFRGEELAGFGSIYAMYHAATAEDVRSWVDQVAVTFNLFFATVGGEVGYFYTGKVPVRAAEIDPRLPTPLDPKTDWRGFIPHERMPHVVNPKSGLLANWNNKPAAWWPNGDTPVWGKLFRNQVLLESLPAGKLDRQDLEMAAWSIARKESWSNSAFWPDMRQALDEADMTPLEADAWRYLRGYDGWRMDGSVPAQLYIATLEEFRALLFQPHVGTFVNPSFFAQAVQPSLVWQAMMGRTQFDYLQGKTRWELMREAFPLAVAKLAKERGPNPGDWGVRAGRIRTPVGEVLYGDRGTFIMTAELRPGVVARSVASPGVAESGPHSADQVPLLAAWGYKPVYRWAGP